MKPSARKLHLGCFDKPAEGWVNTDVTPHIWVAKVPAAAYLLHRFGKMTTERYEQHKRGVFKKVRYMNVTRPFPYRSHTFDAVFSCHMLEHLRPDQAEFCLAECFRVLAREGVCRVVVPDLDILVSSYDSRRPEAFLAGIYEPVRHARGKNTHHWLYNANSLIALLRSIGFAEAYRCDYRKGRCPDINTLDNRPEGSLFVEGVK